MRNNLVKYSTSSNLGKPESSSVSLYTKWRRLCSNHAVAGGNAQRDGIQGIVQQGCTPGNGRQCEAVQSRGKAVRGNADRGEAV